MHSSFEIIYMSKNFASKFYVHLSLCVGSNLIETFAGVVTGVFDFFHIKPPFFFYAARLRFVGGNIGSRIV